MNKEEYILLSVGEIYADLRDRGKLHLIDYLFKEGYLTSSQYRDIKSLKEGLDDSTKMET